MSIVTILLSTLGLLTIIFSCAVSKQFFRAPKMPGVEATVMSAVANFFDALGIGSFATSTVYMKLRRMVPDELIPPTMIVGYATATAAEAFIYITSIEIDPVLLCACIVASSLGSFVGVSVAPLLPVRTIRLTMAFGLLIAAFAYAISNLGLMPSGGIATALPPGAFLVAVLVSFVLGILINLGIGSFAPTLITLSLLGMDPRAAFPIMMGSAAFLLVTSGIKVVRARPLDLSVIAGMILGGVPGVLVAAYFVRTLPLDALRWGVVMVVSYAGILMLKAATNAGRDRDPARKRA